MDPKVAAPRVVSRTRRWLVFGPLGLAASFGTWWLMPDVGDQVVHGTVSEDCDKNLTLFGTAGEDRILGRHCRTDNRSSDPEVGFFTSFEYAHYGQVLLWGPGARPVRKSDSAELSLALVRTPGEAGRWFCAGAGTWRKSKGDLNELALEQVGVLLDEHGLTGTGSVVAEGDRVTATIGERSIAATRTAFGCEQNGSRCKVIASELTAITLVVRLAAGEVVHGFVVEEDRRAGLEVGLAVARSGRFERIRAGLSVARSGHSESTGGGYGITLDAVSALAKCPQATPGSGSLLLRWND